MKQDTDRAAHLYDMVDQIHKPSPTMYQSVYHYYGLLNTLPSVGNVLLSV